MTGHELSRDEARRIAVRAQLLDDDRPVDLLDAVRRLTMLQADATAAVAPSAEIVAWSRLGPGFGPGDLDDALAARTLIELRGMIRPAEDLALYRPTMARMRSMTGLTGWQLANMVWVEDNDSFRRDVLARLDAEGPLSAGELPDTSTRAWKSTGWNNNRNVPLLLEMLEIRGEVAVAGRRGRGERLWDLAERVFPDGPAPSEDDAARVRNERRLRSLGLARSRGAECPVEPVDVGDAGEPAVIEGVRGTWRVDPAQLGRPFHGRAALLSPLDRLVYDRKRMSEIFDFDYALEMYKPAAKRQWGYWALPILFGDRLIGKLDATADRTEGVLRINAVHEDIPFTPEMTADIDREIDGLASCLGLEPVRQ